MTHIEALLRWHSMQIDPVPDYLQCKLWYRCIERIDTPEGLQYPTYGLQVKHNELEWAILLKVDMRDTEEAEWGIPRVYLAKLYAYIHRHLRREKELAPVKEMGIYTFSDPMLFGVERDNDSKTLMVDVIGGRGVGSARATFDSKTKWRCPGRQDIQDRLNRVYTVDLDCADAEASDPLQWIRRK